MMEKTWDAVDRWFGETIVASDAALDSALAESDRAGLPAIAVAPNQGKLIGLLARMVGARRILEIGTLGGYSTIWLARALPEGGKVVTLEYNPHHAAVAKANIARAGLADRVDIRVGPALETLPHLAQEGGGPFDFAFIDADKKSNPDYFAWALKLGRPGGVILVDNVVRGGAVADPRVEDENVEGVRRLHALIAAEPRVDATALQTVGAKGYDGFTIALILR
ncbi:O-methyltransferase [Prosthecomicrobium pneumaticum]|uniref:Putative O-methyltransferase YrrM n=1 Tax=Prosthecomicrobium pneumaticum TaxID=81895 RepID=A0A7W9CUA7_9HYPH|nr:O-methyltransferase [Prosthecomicrobium pneumaticum]MBB5751774.1 putative O-methyltransferase YrrM [Prosthecomicrobium pneumaticum]